MKVLKCYGCLEYCTFLECEIEDRPICPVDDTDIASYLEEDKTIKVVGEYDSKEEL